MTKKLQKAVACVFGSCKDIQEEPPQDSFKTKLSSSLVIQSQPQQPIIEYSENSNELVANFINIIAKKIIKRKIKKKIKQNMMKKAKKGMIKEERRAIGKMHMQNDEIDREKVSPKMGLIERFKKNRAKHPNMIQQKENEKQQQKQAQKQQLQKAIAKINKPAQDIRNKNESEFLAQNQKQRNRGFVKKYDGKEIDFDRGNQTEEIKTVSAEDREQYSREALQRFGLPGDSREKTYDYRDPNIYVKKIRRKNGFSRQAQVDQLPETETIKQNKTVKYDQQQSIEQKMDSEDVSHKLGLIEKFKRTRAKRLYTKQQKIYEKQQQKQKLKEQLKIALRKIVGMEPSWQSQSVVCLKPNAKDDKVLLSDLNRSTQTQNIKTVSAEDREQYSRDALQRFGLSWDSRHIPRKQNKESLINKNNELQNMIEQPQLKNCEEREIEQNKSAQLHEVNPNCSYLQQNRPKMPPTNIQLEKSKSVQFQILKPVRNIGLEEIKRKGAFKHPLIKFRESSNNQTKNYESDCCSNCECRTKTLSCYEDSSTQI